MFDWPILIGSVIYTVVGMLMMNVVSDYLKELEVKVAEVDVRYCERLYYHIPVIKTKFNKCLADVAFLMLWPAICIAAILKAERQYDIIVRHAVNRRA